jgi:hypothetical protein
LGQAKRRHVLRYLAARERAGIVGAGPFNLDEALVRLDARMTAGCRWALAVAVELALTKQRPECSHCRGAGSFVRGQMTYLDTGVRPCAQCRGSGRNTRATLPWPAWLRRKGREAAGDEALRRAAMLGHSIPDWARFAFSATCETFVECTDEARRPVPVAERRAETRTRSFPRGAHHSRDPWLTGQLAATRHVVVHPAGLTPHLPAWLLGERRHAEQRRERARRSAGKADRARRVGVGYSRELSGSWAAEGSELERWRSELERWRGGVRDQADALGYAVQPREPLSIARYSTPGPARHWAREPEWRQEVHGEWVDGNPDAAAEVEQRRRERAGHAQAERDGHFATYSTPGARPHWARDTNRGTGRTTRMLEQAAGHNGEVVIVGADERHVAGLRRYVEGIGADRVQVMSVAAVVAGGLRGWSPLVLWDHYALERFPGVDPALYSRDAVAG